MVSRLDTERTEKESDQSDNPECEGTWAQPGRQQIRIETNLNEK